MVWLEVFHNETCKNLALPMDIIEKGAVFGYMNWVFITAIRWWKHLVLEDEKLLSIGHFGILSLCSPIYSQIIKWNSLLLLVRSRQYLANTGHKKQLSTKWGRINNLHYCSFDFIWWWIVILKVLGVNDGPFFYLFLLLWNESCSWKFGWKVGPWFFASWSGHLACVGLCDRGSE